MKGQEEMAMPQLAGMDINEAAELVACGTAEEARAIGRFMMTGSYRLGPLIGALILRVTERELIEHAAPATEPKPCADDALVRLTQDWAMVCTKPDGHDGPHRSANGSTWDGTVSTRAVLPQLPGEPKQCTAVSGGRRCTSPAGRHHHTFEQAAQCES